MATPLSLITLDTFPTRVRMCSLPSCGLCLSFVVCGCGCGCGGRRQVIFRWCLFVPVRAKWREMLRQQRQLVANDEDTGAAAAQIVAIQSIFVFESMTSFSLLKGSKFLRTYYAWHRSACAVTLLSTCTDTPRTRVHCQRQPHRSTPLKECRAAYSLFVWHSWACRLPTRPVGVGQWVTVFMVVAPGGYHPDPRTHAR